MMPMSRMAKDRSACPLSGQTSSEMTTVLLAVANGSEILAPSDGGWR